MPDAPKRPQFTGQAVWRYNFPRPPTRRLHVYNGPIGVGLVPISQELMYMYVTTPEPGNPRYPRDRPGRAAMREQAGRRAPQIARWRADHRRRWRRLPPARRHDAVRRLARRPRRAARRRRPCHDAAPRAGRGHGDRGQHRARRGAGAARHAEAAFPPIATAGSSAAATSSRSRSRSAAASSARRRRSTTPKPRPNVRVMAAADLSAI
jgi:hypothetical protein